jgi:hypothetical protein
MKKSIFLILSGVLVVFGLLWFRSDTTPKGGIPEILPVSEQLDVVTYNNAVRIVVMARGFEATNRQIEAFQAEFDSNRREEDNQ